jgi:hypothetical protein
MRGRFGIADAAVGDTGEGLAASRITGGDFPNKILMNYLTLS